jgi:hypothetical protein
MSVLYLTDMIPNKLGSYKPSIIFRTLETPSSISSDGLEETEGAG